MDLGIGYTDRQRDIHAQPPNRLILCFDGTGNMFQGNPGDTNIVKLYGMFDRNNTSQMHYYQRKLRYGTPRRLTDKMLQLASVPILPKGQSM